MSQFSDDQIHPATPTRRLQAARVGNFAKSVELAAPVQNLGAIAIAFLMFGQLGSWLRNATSEIWSRENVSLSLGSGGGSEHASEQITGQLSGLMFSSLSVIAPIGLMLMGVGVLSHWFQTGPVFVTKNLAPDAGRMSPVRWFSRLFSWSSFSFPVIGLPKALLAVGVMVASCYLNRDLFYELGSFAADEMVRRLFSLVMLVCTHVAAVLLVASVLDYGLKYMGHEHRLRLTEQQLREEQRMESSAGRRR
jgi:flagellar biosynthetic protein FlhB